MRNLLIGLGGIAIALALLLGGQHVYEGWLRRAQTQAQTTLLASARIKAEQLALWRHERLGDGEVLVHNALLADHLAEWMASDKGRPLPAAIRDQLEALLRHYGYAAATIVDAEARPRYSSGSPGFPAQNDQDRAHLAESWRTHQAILSDLHRDDNIDYPHLHLIAPLFVGNRPVGAIVLLIRASDALYPLLASLPLPSRSGEAFIVRRQGDAVLCLSELRHRPNAALNFSRPLSETDLPAVRALLGETGLTEGRDYRGIAVAVATVPVAGTPWMLIVKQDMEEILSGVRREAWLWGGWLLAFLGLLSAILRGLVKGLQYQHARSLRQAADAERISLARFRHLFEQSQDGILLLTGNDRFLDANPAALRLLGYELEALRQIPLISILAPEEHPRLADAVGDIMGSRRHHEPWVHVRKDGSRFVADVTAQLLTADSYFAILRDITEQQRLERQEATRSAVLELLAGGAPLKDILEAITRGVESAQPGMLCSILLLDSSGRRLATGAAPSLPDFYNRAVDGLAIGPGAGACGEAAHTGQRVIAADLQTHPNWSAFRALIQQAQLGACWSEPVLGADGAVLGTFAIYHRAPATPNEAEIQLIEQAAKLAAIAIERHRARAALALSEQRYAMANQATSEVIWDWNIETHEVWWNDNFYSHYGYRRNETPPSYDNWVRHIHPADRAGVLASLTGDLASTAGLWTSQYRFRHHSGAYAVVYARGVIQRDAASKPLRLVGAMQDVTERKQFEQRLAAAADRYERMLRATKDAFWLVEAGTGRIVDVNRAAETQSGYSREELLRLRVSDIDILHDPDAFRERVGGILAEGWGVIETRHRTKSDRIIDVEVSTLPDADQRTMIAFLRDITSRKQAERAIQSLNEELAGKVVELERANAAKSQFLAHMSHEIRTPMNGVLGMAQLLAQEPLSPGQAVMVRHIGEAGESLLRIIDDILDFSKIEAGELRVEQQAFQPAATLRQVENLLRPAARLKGLDLTVAAAELPGRLIGDAMRLEQILLNLLGNAIKFTEHGGVTLTVTPVTSGAGPVRLRFAVRDTGIGIEPDALSRLFQPFSQGDSSITRRFGGTGLGLVISRRLVELMGGTLGAESTPGQGSTFWCEIPFARVNPATGVSPVRATPTPAATAEPRLAGLRVLLVDDNRINLLVGQKALEHEGAHVGTARDGQQALERLRATPDGFDIVLMDIQMPVMDGLTATREIRRNPALAGLPVIALSAGVLPEERQAALAAGLNDFLPKPINIDRMAAMLRQHCPA